MLKQRVENRDVKNGGGCFEHNQPRQPENQKEPAGQQNPSANQPLNPEANDRIDNIPPRSRNPSPDIAEENSNLSSIHDR